MRINIFSKSKDRHRLNISIELTFLILEKTSLARTNVFKYFTLSLYKHLCVKCVTTLYVYHIM